MRNIILLTVFFILIAMTMIISYMSYEGDEDEDKNKGQENYEIAKKRG